MSAKKIYRYREIALADPVSAAIWGFVFFLALFLVAPIKVAQDYSFMGPLYLALMYAFFFLGVFSFRGFSKGILNKSSFCATGLAPLSVYKKLFLLLLFLALFAEVTWLVDRFVFRSLSLDADVLERREAVESTGTTFFSIFSALFSAASFLVWYLVLAMKEIGRVPRWIVLSGFVVFWLPALNTTFLGSRSTMMVSLIYFLLLTAYYRRRRIGFKAVSLLLVTLVAALTFVVQAFLERLELMNMSAVLSIEESVYAFTLQPDPALVRALNESQSDFLGAVLFGVSNVAQYYCHGVFELFYQIDNFSGSTHSLGATLFFVPYKFVGFVVPLPDVFQLMKEARPHYGSYGSFFGPVHSDFGWFGVVYMFIFGYLSAWIYRLSWRNSAFSPLYVFWVVTIFFFPVFNVFMVGVGFYMLTGFVLFGLYATKKRVAF